MLLPQSGYGDSVVEQFDIFGPLIGKTSTFLVARGEDQVDEQKQQNVMTRALRLGQ